MTEVLPRHTDTPARQERLAIRRAFAAAAPRYDKVAAVQRRIADALLAPASLPHGLVLDAGAGTGYLAQALRARGHTCLELDHAHAMLAHAPLGICADLEALPLASASIQSYCSSLAWQWVDPAAAIREAARVLTPGGELLVATLGPDTLHELRKAFRAADAHEHVRQFAHPDSYRPLLCAAGFTQIDIQRQAFLSHAPDLRAILHGLRQLGAHVLGPARARGLSSPRRWQRLEAAYETLREAPGLPLTHDAIFLRARRT